MIITLKSKKRKSSWRRKNDWQQYFHKRETGLHVLYVWYTRFNFLFCFGRLLICNLNSVRFQFVASPNCQSVLNEIAYRGWRNWRDAGLVRKTLWLFLHIFLVAITCPVYIPVRFFRRSCSCRKLQDHYCWKFRKLYELPYAKCVNHTTSYMLFLSLLFASSFGQEIGASQTGLAWIGKFHYRFSWHTETSPSFNSP